MPLYHLTPGQYRGSVRFFNQNSTQGRLGPAEIDSILQKFNINASDEDIHRMIKSISIDPLGIDMQAFLDYMATHVDYRDQEQEYMECFRMFDKSGSGSINRSELKYVMTKLGNTKIDLDDLMDEVDLNKDGQIDIEEFLILMKKC